MLNLAAVFVICFGKKIIYWKKLHISTELFPFKIFIWILQIFSTDQVTTTQCISILLLYSIYLQTYMVLLIFQYIGIESTLFLLLCSHCPRCCKSPVMTNTGKIFTHIHTCRHTAPPDLERITLVSVWMSSVTDGFFFCLWI